MREVVIKISDELYEYIVKGKDLSEEQNDEMALAIADGKPLPEHHGRLIDEQQIIDRFKPIERFKDWIIGLDGLVSVLSDAPTIIEGSEECVLDNIRAEIEARLCDVETLPSVTPQQKNEDMGEVSDGYHTFNQLYHQRAILFATIVNQNKDRAWKSYKHEDGKYCFDKDGEWFIVGIDTPKGSYTYHYSKEYWGYFDCEELECGKPWDGHTEEDVIRLLSLPSVTPQPKVGEWIVTGYDYKCTNCEAEINGEINYMSKSKIKYCPYCGIKLEGECDNNG